MWGKLENQNIHWSRAVGYMAVGKFKETKNSR